MPQRINKRQAPLGNIVEIAIDATVSGQFNTNSTSYVDVTGASVTITTSLNSTGKVLLTANVGWVDNSAAGNLNYIAITDSSNNVLVSAINNQATNNRSSPVGLSKLVTGLSANTAYTFKLRAKTAGGTLYLSSTVITNGITLQAEEK